jgi:peptide/nickel transport system permease protein
LPTTSIIAPIINDAITKFISDFNTASKIKRPNPGYWKTYSVSAAPDKSPENSKPNNVMSIPSFYLLIILAAILPSNMTSTQRLILIVVILALIGWAGFARVVRGMVLSIKNQEFVQSAKMIGASNLRIIIREILPQTTSYVIVAMTLSVPSYILSESGLSFLGLGIQQPDASWGNMLKEAQEYMNILYRPWLLTPGFLIFVAVLSFNLIGDTIRDVLDPKSRMR